MEIINKIIEKEIVFIDYEGTISQKPKGSGKGGKVILSNLLFDNVFEKCQPVFKAKQLLELFDPKNIYVLGVVDTNNEIEQKYRWLDKFYPFILKKNTIFISSNYKKADVIIEYQKRFKISKDKILFLDDKEDHLNFVRDCGITCYNINDVIKEL